MKNGIRKNTPNLGSGWEDKKKKRIVIEVGFEPTHLSILR